MTPDDHKKLKEAFDRNYEALKGSAVFVSLYHPNMANETIPVLQLGLAVLLNKPIIVAAEPGTLIPANLLKLAVGQVQMDRNNPEALAKDIRVVIEDIVG